MHQWGGEEPVPFQWLEPLFWLERVAFRFELASEQMDQVHGNQDDNCDGRDWRDYVAGVGIHHSRVRVLHVILNVSDSACLLVRGAKADEPLR